MAQTDMRPRCFLAFPRAQRARVVDAMTAAAEAAGYGVVHPLAGSPMDLTQALPSERVLAQIAGADCVVADISGNDPTVLYELGLARATGKPVIYVMAQDGSWAAPPEEILPQMVMPYTEDAAGLAAFSQQLAATLEDVRTSPRSAVLGQLGYGIAPPFIDWDMLGPRDAENLCRELLSQMGFRKLDWGKVSPEIDLIAELPKKDPDGFEYRELWLVSIGLRAPAERLFHMIGDDIDFALRRLLRYSERLEEALSRDYGTSVTLLLILLRNGREHPEVQRLAERYADRRRSGDDAGPSVRVRIWDRDYLTSLVQQFPGIAYKYFSDEGRMGSATRKSPEELYRENSELTNRLAQANAELVAEKNMRIRAERDAVWKDISFSAAHKIGNPIFAIETDLGPLERRIHEEREADALGVVDNIRSSVEKAKAFVEQFKSLAKAQEIEPVPTLVRPILEDACHAAVNQGVRCVIECRPEVEVLGDPEKLAECFDELVINATQWLDHDERLIRIHVETPGPDGLPDFLDTSRAYVLAHVEDNGPGIQSAEKSRIFDAFFTHRDQGTGLGLALVRRILEGHGGGIIEIGTPGVGAHFEVFLPSAPPDETGSGATSQDDTTPTEEG